MKVHTLALSNRSCQWAEATARASLRVARETDFRTVTTRRAAHAPIKLAKLPDHRCTGGSGQQIEQRRERAHRLALHQPLSRLG